jgi:hypothetical protein
LTRLQRQSQLSSPHSNNDKLTFMHRRQPTIIDSLRDLRHRAMALEPALMTSMAAMWYPLGAMCRLTTSGSRRTLSAGGTGGPLYLRPDLSSQRFHVLQHVVCVAAQARQIQHQGTDAHRLITMEAHV